MARNPKDESAQSIMLRRTDRDERSYLATVLDVSGVIHRIRRFVRVSG